jgi:hypothetical protein
LHSLHEPSERQCFFEYPDQLSPNNLLLRDRDYSCCWLVVVLNQRGAKFRMRVYNDNGFARVREVTRLNANERIVMPRASERPDVIDNESRLNPQALAFNIRVGLGTAAATALPFNGSKSRCT